MNKWIKMGIGILSGLLLLSVFINLSLIGFFPSIFKSDLPNLDTLKETEKNPVVEKSVDQYEFIGTKEDAYYVCVFRKDADYWKGVYKGFEDAGNQLGVRTVFAGCNEYDANAQLLVFEEIVAKKPKGIALSPISPEIFKEPIDRAVAAGIKVTCIASDSPDSKRSTLVTSDNVAEGIAAADFIAEQLNGVGEIGIIERPNQSNHAKRVETLIERITEAYPNIKIVARATADGDEGKAARVTMEMIKENPKIDFIFCVAGIEGRGAGVGVKESGKPVKVFCIDADPPVIDMLNSGEIFAVIQPNAYNQGYWSMLSLFIDSNELLDPISDWKESGKSPLPAVIDNGFDFVTKENGKYFYFK